MKKVTAFSPFLALTFLLTACGANNSHLPSEEKLPNETEFSQTSENEKTGVQTANSNSNDFSGSYFTVDGKPLIIPPKNEWKNVDELNAAEKSDMEAGIYGDYYFVSGTAYIRDATGSCDADCGSLEVEWREMNKGEKTGALTVEEANTVYWYFPSVDAFRWNTMDIKFSGEVTLKGVVFSYINDLDSPKGGFYGDGFYFVPFPNALKESAFPMMCDTQMTKGKVSPANFSFGDGYTVCGDTVSVQLKNIDEMKERLVGGLNEYGYFSAEITLKDPYVSIWCEDGIPHFAASPIRLSEEFELSGN